MERIPKELQAEIVAKLDPSEWSKINTTFPNMDWKQVILLAGKMNYYEQLRDAFKREDVFVVDVILQHVGIHLINHKLLNMACGGKSVAIVERLLKDTPKELLLTDNHALEYACSFGSVEIVKFLLSHPLINPADHNNQCIIDACVNERADVIKLLLDYRPSKDQPQDWIVDPTVDDNECLFHACIQDMVDVVKVLLEERGKPSPDPHISTIPTIDPSYNDNYLIKFLQKWGYHQHVNEDIITLLCNDPRVREKL